MSNAQVAATLNEVADLLELKGENAFKVSAYRRAAEAIQRLGEPVEDLWREGRLESVSGVGKSISGKIEELFDTGCIEYLEDLKAAIPAGVLSLLQIPEVGPRKAMALFQGLGVQSVADLEQAASEGKVRTLPGLGARTEERILHNIRALVQRSGRTLLGMALPAARELIASLTSTCPDVQRISIGGSLRRMKPTIGDIDILITSSAPREVLDCFTRLPSVAEVVTHGDEKSTVILQSGLQVDLMVLPSQNYGSLLQHFTGSKEHNIQLRGLALEKGLSLSEHGFSRNGRVILCPQEEDVYRMLGLSWIAPELREGWGEIEAARDGRLPNLVGLEDVKGDLHVHTSWSDGVASAEDMARTARDLGRQYICISDHSRGLGVAHGLTVDRVRQQWQEIAVLNEKLNPFRLLRGSEVEIKTDGSLDFPDEILSEFDVVVASLHSGLRQERARVTERLIAAMRNPHVDIVGHPTGRVIDGRDPADLDMEAVFRVAAETNTALEINASPSRLDLDEVHVRRAIQLGVKLVISTDSHHPESLRDMEYGVAVARRGWAEAGDVLNTEPVEKLLRWLASRGSGPP